MSIRRVGLTGIGCIALFSSVGVVACGDNTASDGDGGETAASGGESGATGGAAGESGGTGGESAGTGGSGGDAGASCETSEVLCDGTCVDATTDRNYCGASDDCSDVAAGESCSAGDVCDAAACKTRTWSVAETIYDDTSTNPTPTDVVGALAETGDAVVLFKGGNSSTGKLFAMVRGAGQADFGAPVELSASTGYANFDVAAGPDGRFVATWENDTEDRVYAASYTSGSGWSPSHQFLTDVDLDDYPPSVVYCQSGAFVVFPTRNTSSHERVVASRLDGTTWSTPEQLDSGNLGSWDIFLACQDEHVAAVWTEENADGYTNIEASLWKPSTKDWSTTTTIANGGDTKSYSEAAVAVTSSGRVLAAFYDSVAYGAEYAEYAGGAWGTATEFEPPSDETGRPAVALGSDGEAHVIYSANPILGYYRAAGASTWTASVPTKPTNTEGNIHHDIFLDEASNVLYQHGPSGGGAYHLEVVRSLSGESTWQTPVSLHSGSNQLGHTRGFDLSALPNGRAMSVWIENTTPATLSVRFLE